MEQKVPQISKLQNFLMIISVSNLNNNESGSTPVLIGQVYIMIINYSILVPVIKPLYPVVIRGE